MTWAGTSARRVWAFLTSATYRAGTSLACSIARSATPTNANSGLAASVTSKVGRFLIVKRPVTVLPVLSTSAVAVVVLTVVVVLMACLQAGWSYAVVVRGGRC